MLLVKESEKTTQHLFSYFQIAARTRL